MSNENNLAIIGSRNFNNYTFAQKEILNIIKDNKIIINKIISGGAVGADKIGEKFSEKFNIPIEIIKPDWSKGKQGGVIRNTDIINKSNYVIAFWDGQSKGTLDSINKAKKLNKKLFIVKIDSETISEGISIGDNEEYIFDFKEDKKGDLLKLKYNKEFLYSKRNKEISSFYSYKINKDIDKGQRIKLLNYIKYELNKNNLYENFLNKAIIGFINNPNFEVNDCDLILIPESSSNINLDIANKLHNKIPSALFLKDVLLKNEIENITLDYELCTKNNILPDTILKIENMIKKATVNGVFKISKVPGQFKKFIINFLKIDLKDKKILNKLSDGKIIIIDDIVTESHTFRECERLLLNYAPKEIILYSLLG